METTPVAAITSGADLFFCEPYSCKLLARACVERQARFAAGIDKTGLRLCGKCEEGIQVKQLSGVVIDPASLIHKGRPPARPSVAVSPEILASLPKKTQNSPAAVVEAPAPAGIVLRDPPLREDLSNGYRVLSGGSVECDSAQEAITLSKKILRAPIGSDFTPTIVSQKAEPPLATPSVDTPPPRDVCDHGIPMDIHCKRCQLTEPLTRETLERAMVVYGVYWGTDNPPDAICDEWVEFFNEHGFELIALSLAALGRITPPPIERRGKYQKHKLGATQQRIVDLLSDGAQHTVTDISRELGQNYQNTRRMLPVLERRGLIRNEFDQLREATVWMHSGAICAKDVTAPNCEVGVSEGEQPCGNPAVNRVRFGKEYLYSCAMCVQGFVDVGAFEEGEDAEVIPLSPTAGRLTC